VAEGAVDEASLFEPEGGPVEGGGDLRREEGFEEARGVLALGEDELEEAVVGLHGGGAARALGHRRRIAKRRKGGKGVRERFSRVG
jgi:hypothetical protein